VKTSDDRRAIANFGKNRCCTLGIRQVPHPFFCLECELVRKLLNPAPPLGTGDNLMQFQHERSQIDRAIAVAPVHVNVVSRAVEWFKPGSQRG
jgi:hypothetical protein